MIHFLSRESKVIHNERFAQPPQLVKQFKLIKLFFLGFSIQYFIEVDYAYLKLWKEIKNNMSDRNLLCVLKTTSKCVLK